jgi:hypothetical protein
MGLDGNAMRKSSARRVAAQKELKYVSKLPPQISAQSSIGTSTLPTPDEIDAVIFDMIAAEAAQVHEWSDTNLSELWFCWAFDPQGQCRGGAFAYTPTEARALAWIGLWRPDCDLRAVPRDVPKGWTFEVYSPDEWPEQLVIDCTG